MGKKKTKSKKKEEHGRQAVATGPEPISAESQRWAAQALLTGMPLAEVIQQLIALGSDESSAATICAQTYAHPVFEAAHDMSQQLRKINSTLAIRSSLASLSSASATIERRSRVSAKAFIDRYYAPNRPVLLTDVANAWPALERWTPSYLIETVGSETVEVMSGREADPDYEVNGGTHRQEMPFDTYVQKVSEAGVSNDLYLVANNHLLESPAAARLWDDFTLDKRYMDPTHASARTFMWFGPAGTITPLHHDTMNVMFHQVVGRKRITLISPLDTPRMYNSRSVYSDVRLEAPDLDRFPSFGDAVRLSVVVEPGEVLFIPVGWWHHVEALDESISVSSTSFKADNHFQWFLPTPLS